VLDREQELVELTAHAACKGSISQLVNCRFETVAFGCWLIVRSENQVPCPKLLHKTAHYGLPLCPFLTVRAPILCAPQEGGEACSNGRGGSLV